MDELISYWQERTGDQKPFWFVIEKTPWFWAQYFGVVKTQFPLAHPNAASKMRVAWLERLRLALNYFVGRSTYNLALLPISSPLLLSQACNVLSDDLDHLQLALEAVFVASGGRPANDLAEEDEARLSQSLKSSSQNSMPAQQSETPSSDQGHDYHAHRDTTHHRTDHQSDHPTSKPVFAHPDTDESPHPSGQSKLGIPHPHVNSLKSSSFSISTRRSVLSQSGMHAGSAAIRQPVSARGLSGAEALDASFAPQAPPAVDDFLNLYRSMDREDQHLRTIEIQSGAGDDEYWRSNSGTTAPLLSASSSTFLPLTTRDHALSPRHPSHSSLDAHNASKRRDTPFTRNHGTSSSATAHDLDHSYQASVSSPSIVRETPGDPSKSEDERKTSHKGVQEVDDHESYDDHKHHQLTGADDSIPDSSHSRHHHHHHHQPYAQPSSGHDDVGEDRGSLIELGQRKMQEELSRASAILVTCNERICQNQRDPYWKREWLRLTVFVAVGGYGAWKLARNWRWLMGEAKSTKAALVTFFKEHAVEPLKSIWRTIRYDDETVGVMSKENLEAEVKSLVRMVHQWNTESPAGILAVGSTGLLAAKSASGVDLSPGDLESMELNVRNGVMPGVMEAWESQLPHPIYNALLGDLLRLALIQVQKQKVDLEKAMAQLDRILKQNAINLQIMAALPAILTFLASSSLIYSYFSHRDPYRNVHVALRQLLHRAGLLINASSSFFETDLPPTIESPGTQQHAQPMLNASAYLPDSDEEDDFADAQLPPFNRQPHHRTQMHDQPHHGQHHGQQQQHNPTHPSQASIVVVMRSEHFGELQCVLSRLLDAASTLPTSERVSFVADLRELAKPQYSSRQRLTTISRMYNNYPFLNASDR